MVMLKPPKTYSLLLTTAAPPGSVVPPAFPGQGSVAMTVRVSVIGLYVRTVGGGRRAAGGRAAHGDDDVRAADVQDAAHHVVHLVSG